MTSPWHFSPDDVHIDIVKSEVRYQGKRVGKMSTIDFSPYPDESIPPAEGNPRAGCESSGDTIEFPLIFEGKGSYKVTYHYFNDFSCEEQTDYSLKLNPDGSAQLSYLENVEGEGIYDELGELVDMICTPAVIPNADFRNGSHDLIKTFHASGRGSGCKEMMNTLVGSFTEFFASGEGTYYRCTSGTGPSETIEIEFENIPEVQ